MSYISHGQQLISIVNLGKLIKGLEQIELFSPFTVFNCIFHFVGGKSVAYSLIYGYMHAYFTEFMRSSKTTVST